MASTTKKRLNTSYILQTVNNTDTVTLDTSKVTITGNLDVLGVTTYIESTTTQIKDSIVQLNQGETGAGVTGGVAGFEIDRGTLADVQLRWNEAVGFWQITRDGTNFANIAITSSLGTSNPAALTAVVRDIAPTLGGNLDLKNYQLFSSTSNYVTVNSNIAIAKTTTTPTTQSGNVVVFTANSGGSQSGVFVNNGVDPVSELTSQVAAMKYAIIFG